MTKSPNKPSFRAGVFVYRDYRLLWVTLMMSSVVVWMRILGTAQWLLDETGSAYLVGLIGVVQLVVQLPVTLWAGTLADRVDRKKLMSLSHGATGTALLILGICSSMSLLTPVMVYIGIAITAATHMLSSPATSALVPIIVPERQLMLASSTETASRNAAAIAGPLLFAIIAVQADLTTVFLVAGVLALLSATLPMFIKVTGRVASTIDEPKVSQVQQTKDGFAYVAKHPILPGLFLLDAGITTASFYREILPVLALGLFAGGASATGMLGAANSVGAIRRFTTCHATGGLQSQRHDGALCLLRLWVYFVWVWHGNQSVDGTHHDSVTRCCRCCHCCCQTNHRDDDNAGSYARAAHLHSSLLRRKQPTTSAPYGLARGLAGLARGNTMVMGGFISIGMTALIWWLWKPIREFRSSE